MTCAEIQADLSLYLYGELDFAAEEAIEIHLLVCDFCQLALHREKQWHAAVNRQQTDVQPEWLSACRAGLFQQIAAEPTTAAQARHRVAGWWSSWTSSVFDIRLTNRSFRLAAVSFLLLLGFAAGRMSNWLAPWMGTLPVLDSAGLVQPSVTQVREIRPEAGNRVRVVLQQMQVREISGHRDDDNMRAILVGAVRQSVDPGVRIDSVEMLSGQTGMEIRNALINTIRNDQNAAVRAKAIESLRKFSGDTSTRSAFEFALAHDSDAGVRAEAMDALVPVQGDLPLTPQLLEILSDVLHSPQTDEYVRWRCAQVLNRQSLSHDIY